MFGRAKEYDYLFKLLLVGPSCGKSQLLSRYADNIYMDYLPSTIGVDFKIKTEDALGSTCKLQIWDTAGLERFRTITQAYYRGAHGIFLCFDMTSMESFNELQEGFANQLDRYLTSKIPVSLVACKSDRADEREVTYQQAKVTRIFNIKYII